jgi:group II intron reverse transcriptase/maturase
MPHREAGAALSESKCSDVETKLDLVSLRARREPSYQFACLAHLLNEGFLERCYWGLGRNKAPGIDGVSFTEYGENLGENLEGLVARMKAKSYRPQPARRVYIPKDEHATRPLGIPAQEDKVVQKGVSRILEAIYEADFLDCSHGFRPNRGCHTALKAVDAILLNKPINHVIEADIKGFFDAVSHKWMMEFLERRIKDPSFLRIIARFLIAGYKDGGLLVESVQGTPQGGNLSPMLANIFLHYVLDEWFETEIKPQVTGECHLVRYADDFIILVQFKEEAYRLVELLRERFGRYDLQLHPDKTRVMSFGRYEEGNARKQERRDNTFDFLGLTHYCTKSRHGGFLVGRSTAAKKFRKKVKELNLWIKAQRNLHTLRELWKMLTVKLRGHYQYYGISGNYRGIYRYYRCALRLAFKWLNRRSQRKSFKWEQFLKYLARYPLPKPHITHRLYGMSIVK